MRLHKRMSVLIAALILGASLSPAANAANVLNTYTYDYWGEEMRSPAGYQVQQVITGTDCGSGDFAAPQDLFITADGTVYVADTDHNRVVILNRDLSFRGEYTSFILNGGQTELNKPTGLYVTDIGELYVVDSGNKRTLRCDGSGTVLTVYEKPDSEEIAFTGVDYIPEKVVADHSGYVFILCKDLYQGAMMYTVDGQFVNYFGSNKPVLTVVQQMQQLTKRFMTKEQRERITQVIPSAISNMDIDEDGFLYVSTAAAGTRTEQLRRLNPKGVNVLKGSDSIKATYENVYGDLETKWANSQLYETAMADVAYEDQLIYGLDRTFGRVFQYDTEGHLVFAFGGIGDQAGLFRQATALDVYDGDVYILDSEKNTVTVMEETDYGAYIHKALSLYNDGLYQEVEQYWQKIIDLNCNYTLAYIGLGKIKYEQQDFRAAMRYFRLGEDRNSYSDSFKQVRNQFLRQWGLPIGIGLVLIVVVILIVRWFVRTIVRSRRTPSKRQRRDS